MPNAFPPIIVISLAKDVERRAAMQRELAGFDFEFFEAMDGSKLDESEYRRRLYAEWHRRIRGRELSPGEIGCFLSHYAVWERIVETGASCALVLEDDARLEDGFALIVEEIMRSDIQWDIVYLAPSTQPVDRVCALPDGRHWLARCRREVGAVGYLIRLEGAEALLHYCWRIRAPIDWLYSRWWENGLRFCVIDPAIIGHMSVPSTIGQRGGRRFRAKRTKSEYIAAKVFRWYDRLHRRAARESVDYG